MKSLYIRFNSCFTSTTAGSSAVRIVVVYDKQANATQCTAAQVFNADAITGMNLLDNRERFEVIIDKMVKHSSTDPIAFKKYRTLNHPVIYNGTNGGTIADIVTGSLTCFVCQQGGIITNAPTNTLRCRVRFVDS